MMNGGVRQMDDPFFHSPVSSSAGGMSMAGGIGGQQGAAGQGSSQSSASGRTVFDVVLAHANSAVTVAKSKLALGPVRSPTVFFGLGETAAFSVPTGSTIVPRLKMNLRYYGSNYLALYATLVALSIVTNPLSLGMLAVAGGGWWVLTKASSNPEVDTVNFGSFSVKKNVAYVVMMAVSVFVGVILLGKLLGWSLWVSGAVAGGHAAMRDATVLIEEEERQANMLEGDLELASFIKTSTK